MGIAVELALADGFVDVVGTQNDGSPAHRLDPAPEGAEAADLLALEVLQLRDPVDGHHVVRADHGRAEEDLILCPVFVHALGAIGEILVGGAGNRDRIDAGSSHVDQQVAVGKFPPVVSRNDVGDVGDAVAHAGHRFGEVQQRKLEDLAAVTAFRALLYLFRELVHAADEAAAAGVADGNTQFLGLRGGRCHCGSQPHAARNECGCDLEGHLFPPLNLLCATSLTYLLGNHQVSRSMSGPVRISMGAGRWLGPQPRLCRCAGPAWPDCPDVASSLRIWSDRIQRN